MTPRDLQSARDIGICPGDLFVYWPDPSWVLHPYMWRIRNGSARSAEDVLREDIVEMGVGETILILDVRVPPDDAISSRSDISGLTVLAQDGVFWIHLDPRVDRSLTRNIYLAGRLWLEPVARHAPVDILSER